MIIPNGTIEFQVTTGGGGFDANGYPVEPTRSWGRPVPCQYYPVRYNAQASVNGEHATLRSYTVLVDMLSVSSERIRLKDGTGAVVGEFQIISSEPLVAVQQTRITI
ncbi:MAG: hypothetical protein IKN32_01125 [Bacteroidales bacterium]|nr:hypothetical protein [Bacteroidales bacterium]